MGQVCFVQEESGNRITQLEKLLKAQEVEKSRLKRKVEEGSSATNHSPVIIGAVQSRNQNFFVDISPVVAYRNVSCKFQEKFR